MLNALGSQFGANQKARAMLPEAYTSENSTMRKTLMVFKKNMSIAFCVMAAGLTASSPARASVGCSAFYGSADNQTKGEGGSRTGHGFSEGDILKITVHESPDQIRMTVNLMEYASPDGPFHAIVDDKFDSFTYTLPKSTSDFIYLNFGGPIQGLTVTWSCTPATTH